MDISVSQKRRTKNADSKDMCLVCGDPIQLNSDMPLGENLAELFSIFCKHMRWKFPEDKRFEFQTEMFPFCEKCRSALVEIFNLNAQLEAILEQVNKLTTNLSVAIISSQERKNTNKDLSVSGHFKVDEKPDIGTNDRRYVYNSEKVDYFRGMTLKRFSPVICLSHEEADPCSQIKKHRSSDDVQIIDVQSHPAEDIHGVSSENYSPKEETQVKNLIPNSSSKNKPGGCGPTFDDFDWRDIISERMQKVRALQLVLYEESSLGLAKCREIWSCCVCHRRFRNLNMKTMERHLMTACSELTKPAFKSEEIPLPISELVIQHWKGELSGFKTIEEISRLTNVPKSAVVELIERYKLTEGPQNDREEFVYVDGNRNLPDHVNYVLQPPVLRDDYSPAPAGDEPETEISDKHEADPESMQERERANTLTLSGVDSSIQFDANFEWSGILKDQIRKVGSNNYEYNGKLVSARDILREFEGPKVRTLHWSNFMRKNTKQVGDYTYLFENTTLIELRIHGGVYSWLCCTCQQWLGIDKAIENHVRPGCKAENNPLMHIVKADDKNFLFKGFGFHRTENGFFKCNHCYYSASVKAQQRILDHISGIHIRQRAISNLVEASGSSTSGPTCGLLTTSQNTESLTTSQKSETLATIQRSGDTTRKSSGSSTFRHTSGSSTSCQRSSLTSSSSRLAPQPIAEKDPAMDIVKIDDKNFLFKGFGFHRTENNYFKCNHCYYSTPVKALQRILVHISGIHIRQRSIANLANDDTNGSCTSYQSELPPIAVNGNEINLNKDIDVREINEPYATTYDTSVVKSEYSDLGGFQYMDTSCPESVEDSTIFGF
ncbi:unnamed protein product [Allacma fusca]|uniref:Uncharacterized protein n=1 Tax=Allacma fusca TaxID=39272 RepID=A0A8J2L1L6_9HEXA|nr:unnamed protein product [Allacma fusca]